VNYTISREWTSVSILTGHAIGMPFSITNAGRAGDLIEVIVSDTQPAVEDRGEPLAQLLRSYNISGQTQEVWIRYIRYDLNGTILPEPSRVCQISIQHDSFIVDQGGIPPDLLTNNIYGVRRIAVDSQQTSFEEAAQFRFFDRILDVAQASQVVYKFSGINAINVFHRELQFWTGGREYLVYPDSPNITFTGTLSVSGRLTPLNSNIEIEGYIPPVTTASMERAVGVDIFDAGTDLPIIGTAVLTDGNSNRSTSVYSPDSIRLGLASNSTVWIVMNHIGANAASSGHVSISYEERF